MLKHAVIPFLVGAGLLASAPFASAATNLVFCSEGSPAGFDPGQYTTGTDFDASAETMFNRLTQFERGGTAVIPGLATKWDISEDGLTYTFHLREGVKFHTTPYFKPTREFNADDVLFTFNARSQELGIWAFVGRRLGLEIRTSSPPWKMWHQASVG